MKIESLFYRNRNEKVYPMKNIFLLLTLFLTACASHAQMHPYDLTIRKEIVIQNVSRERLFEMSKIWITRHLYSQKDIIAHADAQQGLIVANGTIDYPAAGELDAIAKTQHTISFIMREEIRDAQIVMTFDNLILNVPKSYFHSRRWTGKDYTGGYSLPIEQREDFNAARRGLLAIAARLEEYLRQK
jgi:hypothetical protein